jgi:acyl-CoA synthetase (AMP-forming)/AMP-acid ligase II/acyl carrier protein
MVSKQTLSEIIHQHCVNQPDAPAILTPGKKSTSYLSLDKQIQSAANWLTQRGFKIGDRIAVVLPNGPELAITFLSVSSVCTCAPLNPAYSIEEFRYSFSDLNVKALITSFPDNHTSYTAARDQDIPIIRLDGNTSEAGLFNLTSKLAKRHTPAEPIFNKPENVALVLHTSGTTSRPKIVAITVRHITHSVENITATYALQKEDRCLNMMPLFHIHGLVGALASSLYTGGSVICSEGFNPEKVTHWITDLSPTWFTAVPTIHHALVNQIRDHETTHFPSSLRFIRSCSSPLNPALAEIMEKIFAVPVLEAYGMTEATHQMASNPLPPKARKFGSVGLPTGSTSIAILNEHGEFLSPNQIGEICIKGANVISAYENNPLANQDSFTAGYLQTGDLGYFDEDGYLFVKGRLKEQINRGGEKISPREIDEVLLAHPAVSQAVAFSMPHSTLGEDIAAAVVLKPGVAVSMRAIRQFAADNLANYKVPHTIVFISEIPKGPTGKIQRISLAEQLKDQLKTAFNHDCHSNFSPRNKLEKEIATIWQRVLRKEELGIHDDFLALGGDSLMAAQLLMVIQKEYKISLDIREIFTYCTIELMADQIQKSQDESLSQ